MHILTTLRAARSLTAGVLIGGSIVATVFAVTVASPSSTQTVLVIAAATVPVFGFTLHVVATRHFGAAPRARLAG